MAIPSIELVLFALLEVFYKVSFWAWMEMIIAELNFWICEQLLYIAIKIKKKSVSALSFTERGWLVAVATCMNAIGNFFHHQQDQ